MASSRQKVPRPHARPVKKQDDFFDDDSDGEDEDVSNLRTFRCVHCQLTADQAKLPQGLLTCVGCRSVSYCNAEHQRLHWKIHKPLCKLLKELETQVVAGGAGFIKVVERAADDSAKTVRKNAKLTLHYVGSQADSVVFDSSIERKAPLTITIGQKLLARGLEDALMTMKATEISTIYCHPTFAFNDSKWQV